jgi:hypothetical protein
VSHQDTLRALNAPLIVRAAQAGADALDLIPKLEAIISGLELTIADLTLRLRQALDTTEES